MKYLKNAKCPICSKEFQKEFVLAQLYLVSWIEFPDLHTLEGGIVKTLCGDAECSRQREMRVGIRFQCWSPGGRK